MSVKVENFGCRLNALEGDVAQAAAKPQGWRKPSSLTAAL